MKALVTGGAGFIGSNLVDALLERGDQVAVIDNLWSGDRANLDAAIERGARLHVVDIRDADEVTAVFDAERPSHVFHLAAQADVRVSIETPGIDASINVIGTVNLLEAARRVGVQRFVNTSTGGAIYGDVDLIPTPESVPTQPMAAYGQSKDCAERYCEWMRRLWGLETVTLRYGNVYGPRQNPAGDAGVIAIFCGAASSGRRPIIFGDGLQTRDYVFVDDIVAANLLAGEQPGARGAYNVGTQTEVTVLQLVAAVREAAGLQVDAFEPEFREARLGELQRSCLDVGRAREELGFIAATSLSDGIARTYSWAQARHERSA
ncbi:NAD-dependent epimerase/dehydratase family protein [Conexibacter sp. W3-3-2]|uniref:NAD-dependent epimerase/dehydratase family protein n=1 Tax=Conexibacter sp. W3-3-2 TaxID=2675227 RepID=UPI0012B7FFB4|nr:NAD-dependent epimerase/dehydratase family protein [Conexibacter sp. W3-3-2]MTD46241.1 NAD-dependent epimerase/dehydratase family protein [Conexibacter sp. W3-3-2]